MPGDTKEAIVAPCIPQDHRPRPRLLHERKYAPGPATWLGELLWADLEGNAGRNVRNLREGSHRE